MLRTPEPKEQARLLVQLLKAEGIALGHQKALNLVARLAGHRNWNVLQARLEAVAPNSAPEAEQAAPAGVAPVASTDAVEALVAAAERVVSNASNEGCSDDLTVTSFSAVERLEEVLRALRRGEPVGQDPSERTVHGFGVGDVRSVRPDLSPSEAMQVLDAAEHRFDASIGLNWDVLRAHADAEFPAYGIAARAVLETGEVLDCTVSLATGSVYLGAPGDVVRQPFSQRTRLSPQAHGSPTADIELDAGPSFAEVFFYTGATDEVHEGDTELLAQLSDELRQLESRGELKRVPLTWLQTGFAQPQD